MAPPPEAFPGSPRRRRRLRAKLSAIADDDEHPLWTFAVAFYGRPHVRATCLALQDEVGLDVDILLAILWAAREGWLLDAPSLRSLLADTASVRAWIEQQRRHRRVAGSRAATDPDWRPVADAALAAELAGERLALRRSYGRLRELSLEKKTQPRDAARDGLTAYAQIMEIEAPVAAFEVLVSALASDPA